MRKEEVAFLGNLVGGKSEMANCLVCKADCNIGGAVYTVDDNTFTLCKSCYGKVETHLLVCCTTCGFYWFSYDELSDKDERGIPIIRITNECVICEFNKDVKVLPAP